MSHYVCMYVCITYMATFLKCTRDNSLHFSFGQFIFLLLYAYFVSFQKSLIFFFFYFPKKKNRRNADFSSTDIGESGPSIQFVAVAFKHFTQTFYTTIRIENYFPKGLCNIFYGSKFSEITLEITVILLQ